MPFVLDLKGGELELIAKTVMRKKDFRTSGPKLAFEGVEEIKRLEKILKDLERKKKEPVPLQSYGGGHIVSKSSRLSISKNARPRALP